MALGGALFELELVLSVPAAAQAGWWDMEWWWNQPGVPHVAEFVAGIQKQFKVTARGAPLVRLRLRAFLQDRRREGQEPGRDQDGARARGRGAAARGGAAAGQASPTAPAITS